ncbi:MAG: cytochrome c [Nannocystaceae bacterium]
MPFDRRVRALVLTFAALGLAGLACEDEDEDPGPPTGSTCPSDSTLTWDNFGEAFMTQYCTRCHSSSLHGADRQGAPSDHNFNTVELVREEIEHTDESAAAGPDATNTSMPIGAPTPTDEERRQLGEWLACGAP